MSVFSERLRELRLEKGELQADVVKILNVSLGSYSAYESAREPRYDVLCELAKHFNTTADYLLGLTNDRYPQGIQNTKKWDSNLSGAVKNLLDSFFMRYNRYRENASSFDFDKPFYFTLLGCFTKIIKNHDDFIQRMENNCSNENINKALHSFLLSIDRMGTVHVGGRVDSMGAITNGISSFEMDILLQQSVTEKKPDFANYKSDVIRAELSRLTEDEE